MRAKTIGVFLLAFGCGDAEKSANPSGGGGQGPSEGSSGAAGATSGFSGNSSSAASGNTPSGGSAGNVGSSNPIGVVLGDTPAEACIAYGWAVCSRREACRAGSQGFTN